MLFDHGAAQAQAQAHAFAASGEEGREQPCAELAVDARPGISDIEGDPAFMRLAHADAQHTRCWVAAVLHRLDGIAREVQQHLLDHGAVADHARRRVRQVGVDPGAALARLQPHQRQHRVEQQVHADGFAQLLAAAHEVVHALDDPPGALGLLGHVLQGLAQQRRCVGIGLVHQVQRAAGIAGNGRQRLVQLVAQQRGHLADGGQPRGGLQPFLLLARQVLDAALRADVEHGAHPAGVLALAVDQRRFIDHDREALAVLAHEQCFEAFARRGLAGIAGSQAQRLPLPVAVGQFGRPVRRRGRFAQLVRREADHGAEGRVDVRDVAVQVARAQPGDQRVFHRLAEGQRLGQQAFGTSTPADIAGQQQGEREQQHRQPEHRSGGQVGNRAGRPGGAVHAQAQRGARQIHQTVRAVHPHAARLAGTRQSRAVAFDE